MRSRINRSPAGAGQRGYALLLTLLLLILAGVGVFFAARDSAAVDGTDRSAESARELAAAADALVAYAVFDGTDAVPGALPCPDFHDASTSDAGESSLKCINDTSKNDKSNPDVFVERFPWRTVDASREYADLWYAIDADFRDETGEVEPLNPENDTGSLTIDGTGKYAGILIAPGAPAGVPDDRLAPENADDDEAFIDCADELDCDDRAYGVESDRLFRLVRKRVPSAVKEGLSALYDNHDYYPWPAPSGESTEQCDSSGDITSGTLPLNEGDCSVFLDWHASDKHRCDAEDCDKKKCEGSSANCYNPMPEWVEANEWHAILELKYKVSSECAPPDGNPPTECDLPVSVEWKGSGNGGRLNVFAGAD